MKASGLMGEGGGGGWGSRIPVPVPLDLPLELTEEYIIKAVFICVPEHNGSFFICKAEWITRQKFSELRPLQ